MPAHQSMRTQLDKNILLKKKKKEVKTVNIRSPYQDVCVCAEEMLSAPGLV